MTSDLPRQTSERNRSSRLGSYGGRTQVRDPGREEAAVSVLGQHLGFRLMRLASSSWLRVSADRISPALPPTGLDAAVHLAAVVRMPPSVAASLVPLLDRLRERFPAHYYYPPDTMHVTISKLGESLPDNPGAAACLPELREVVASQPSFDLTVRGLNLSPTTVFAEVVPNDRAFFLLRGNLTGIVRRNVRQSRGKRLRDAVTSYLAHANVVRFSGPVTSDLIKEVSGFRRARSLRWTVRAVEIVLSDRLLSREGTRVIERAPLGRS